jgi:hypothetical protein
MIDVNFGTTRIREKKNKICSPHDAFRFFVLVENSLK